MVSSGTVRGHCDDTKKVFDSYEGQIADLSSSWKGLSYENLHSKAESFKSEFLNGIEQGMSSFAAACDYYQEYVETKRKLAEAQSALASLSESDDASTIASLQQQISAYQAELERLKGEINSALSSASGTVLTASENTEQITPPTGTMTQDGPLTPEQISAILDAAKSQYGVPYSSMNYGPNDDDDDQDGFGCAMFVSYCYNQVLFGGAEGQSKGEGGFYGSCKNFWGNVTNDNFNAYNKGFVEVSASEARPTDIVCFLDPKGGSSYDDASSCYHVGLYLGDGKMAHSSRFITDGVGECKISDYLNVRGRGREYKFLRYVGV